MKRTLSQTAAIATLAALLAGCEPATEREETPALPDNGSEETLTNNILAPAPEPTSEGKSIIRPEAEIEPEPTPPPLEPIERTVQFAKGFALDEQATAALDALLAEPALQAGGPIRLSGHSDSKGSDTANLRTSRRRAEAVRDYLVEHGVAEDRIEVIALGEMRPVAPNANPDGSVDEAGRARNRRVDIAVALPAAEAPTPAAPTPEATPAG